MTVSKLNLLCSIDNGSEANPPAGDAVLPDHGRGAACLPTQPPLPPASPGQPATPPAHDLPAFAQ